MNSACVSDVLLQKVLVKISISTGLTNGTTRDVGAFVLALLREHVKQQKSSRHKVFSTG